MITDREWESVQRALVAGGLRECIEEIVLAHTVQISDANRQIIEEAYDDGVGSTVTFAPPEDPPWFVVTQDGLGAMIGIEHRGTLYSVVPLSGGGLVAVMVGHELIDNEVDIIFNCVADAKAYVQGLMAAK